MKARTGTTEAFFDTSEVILNGAIHFVWVAQLIQNLVQSSIVARWSPVLPVISVFDLGDTKLHAET